MDVMNNVIKRLFEEMIRDTTVSSILQTAYEILGNPIIATDATYRLLGCFPQRTLNDPVWDTLYLRGFVEQESILMMEVDKTREECLKHDETILLNWGFAQDIPRLSCKISSANKMYGYVGVLEYDRPFVKTDYEILDLVCKILYSLVKQRTLPSNEFFLLKQSLLANLLDGGVSSQEILDQAVSNAKLRIQPPFCILAVPLDLVGHDNYKLHKSCNLINEITNVHMLNHGGNIVLYICSTNIETSIEAAAALLSSCGLSCGASDIFNELINASYHYRQALAVAEIGKAINSNSLCRFSDYAPKYLIQSALKQEDPKVFIFPGVRKLIEYDREYKTEFSVTLHTYLTNYKNTHLTSEILHIHRNSMAYRLRKCEEIAKFSLSNNNQCRYIQISLEIMLEKERSNSL